MVNIFDLGIKGFREWSNIERAVRLVQPVVDEYETNKSVIDDIIRLIDELERVKAKAMPIVAAYQNVEDELIPLVQHLNDVFFPHERKKAMAVLPTPAGGYNVKWLQQSLIDISEAGEFTWPRGVNKKHFVDGDPGDKTKAVTKAFQQKQVDGDVSGWDEADVDGWAGIKTCARIYNILAEIKT